MSRCESWGVPPFLNGCAVFAHKHALALAHASRGGKCKRWGSPPGTKWRAVAGRSAQAQRGRLGCLLSRARDGVPQRARFPCISVKRRDCFFWVPASRGGRCPGKARRDVWWKTARPTPTFSSSYDQQTEFKLPFVSELLGLPRVTLFSHSFC